MADDAAAVDPNRLTPEQAAKLLSAAAKVRVKLTSDKDIDTSDFAVTPGDALSINMLRVFYRWPVMTDLMRSSMSNLKDGKTLLFSTITWRNEPYS